MDIFFFLVLSIRLSRTKLYGNGVNPQHLKISVHPLVIEQKAKNYVKQKHVCNSSLGLLKWVLAS